MVIIFANKHGNYDFIVQTSIAFALAKLNFSEPLDESVVAFSPGLNMHDAEKIALVGHGSPGSIEGVSAESIGNAMADPVRGVGRNLRRLIVTSCYAGVRPDPSRPTSTVEVLASKLRGRGLGGLEIVGYNGPSIKNAELGFFASVVNDPTPGAAIDSPQLTQARAQSNISVMNTKKDTGDLSLLKVNQTTNIGNLGKKAAVSSKSFYANFIEELSRQQLLLQGDDVARVAVVLD